MPTPSPNGPDEQEREQPGNDGPNPTGVSTDQPAEGDEDSAPRQPGSPQG